MNRVLWLVLPYAAAMVSCSNGSGSHGSGSSELGAGGSSLAGTWDLMTTATGGGPVTTTLVIGQDSLNVISSDFSVRITRTGDTLAFTDKQSPNDPSNNVTVSATQMAGAFDTGVLPFNLGGQWTIQIVPTGQSVVMTCTLGVAANEIDGACHALTQDGFDFNFTTAKMSSAASSFGDFGGKWLNTWSSSSQSGGSPFPCEIDFVGSTITTCAGGPNSGGGIGGNPLAGITFTYDGVNTASGAAHGWAEFSATRR